MKTNTAERRNTEAVTIPRAEYEQMQGQISAQEKQISVLRTEAGPVEGAVLGVGRISAAV